MPCQFYVRIKGEQAKNYLFLNLHINDYLIVAIKKIYYY